MGLTNVSAIVSNFRRPSKKVNVKFLVDTGASYTVIPDKYVKQLGIKPVKKQEFALADGTIVTRKLGHAMIEINGDKAPTTVVLGEKDDSLLLGVVTLEAMGLMVDPFKRKLLPMHLMLG